MRSVVCITIVTILLGCQFRNGKGADPKINSGSADFVFTEEFHNFGSLQAGEIVSYGFCIKNTGSAGLKIEQAETDCGCISVDYPKETVSPGDSAFIDVVFNSAGEMGRVYKEIVINTNARERQKAKLGIAADVKTELIKSISSAQKR